MTSGAPHESFGPYVFTLTSAEADAAAAHLGTRAALKGGCVRHIAPFLIFALVVAFAFLLALFGLISQRAGKTALFLAAIVFVAQRIISNWLVWRAHASGRRAALVRLQSEGELAASIDKDGLSLLGGGRRLRLRYTDCAEVEDLGALIYVWPRKGEPILLPKRVLPEGEAALLFDLIKLGVGKARAARRSTASRSGPR